MAELMMLSPAQLQLAPYNPRKSFDDASLAELAESLKAQGMLQPVLVRQHTPAKGKKAAIYEVVCGARRTKAAQLAALQNIPCNVAELTDDQAIEAAITENLQRQDVAPMEEARAFAALLDRGYTLQQLGERFGKSHVHIWNRVQLAKATPELQAAIEAGTIPLTYARELAKFPEHIQQKELEGRPFFAHYREPKAYRTQLVERYGNALEKAPFDLAEAGCAACPFNAINLGLGKEAVCLNEAKYEEHVRKHVLALIADMPSFLPLVVVGYHYDRAVKMWQGLLPEGRHLTKTGWSYAYEMVHEPDMPEFEAPDREDYEDEAEYAEALEEANAEFAEARAVYESDLEDFKKEIKTCKRAICMYGEYIGNIVYIKATGKADDQQEEPAGEDEQAARRRELALEIASVNNEIERNPVLASERAYEVAREQINALAMYKGIDSIEDQPALIDEEMDALYLHMVGSRIEFFPDNVRRAIMGKTYERFSFTAKQIEAALAVKKQLWPLAVRQYLKMTFQHMNGSSCSTQERYAWDKIAMALADVDYSQIAAVRAGYAAKLEKAEARKKELQAAYDATLKEVAQ